MMTRKGMSFLAGRNAALVATAALALTAFTPVTGAKAETTIPAARMETPNATATDFSAARRHRAVRHHRHYRRGGNAAAAGEADASIGAKPSRCSALHGAAALTWLNAPRPSSPP